MNKIKKILMIGLIGLVAIGSTFAKTEKAEVTLITNVGENIENAGIRVTEDSNILDNNNFDNSFLSATSAIMLENEGDSALTGFNGSFSVLIRRANKNPVYVAIKVTPLKSGGNTLGFKVTSASTLIRNMEVTNRDQYANYFASTVLGGRIRDQKILNVEIPRDWTAAKGRYRATITFTMTII